MGAGSHWTDLTPSVKHSLAMSSASFRALDSQHSFSTLEYSFPLIIGKVPLNILISNCVSRKLATQY